MAFDAEEEGLLGSKYFVNNPLIPLANIKAMMNFDMVGRLNSENKLQLHGTGTALETDTLLKMTLAKYNFKPTFDPGGNGPSDYAAFYGKNIPVIALTTGIHPDYHTPADKPEKINYSGMVKIVDFSSQILIDLANREKPLTFKQVETAGEYKNVRRGKATLGIMPDFSGAEKIGVRVDGVTKGKPAEKAGILKDDIIIGINGTPVKDIYEYMFQMGKHKQGDKIIIDVKRKEETIHIEVEL